MNNTLTLDRVRELAPAAFSTERAPGLTKRYHTYRTIDVLQPVLADGWEIAQAGQAASYAESDNRFYKRHLIRISKAELVVEDDGDPYRIDALIVNSNDGTLGRVKKEQILEAISEGTSETNLEDLRKMKKADLVAAAERRLAESRWLPQLLRHSSNT